MPKEADYDAIIFDIFKSHHKKGVAEFTFARQEMEMSARKLGIAIPKNLGDVIYSFRFRKPLPAEVVATEPKGKEWIIELAGHGRYRFRLAATSRIIPRPELLTIKIPDATPEIIRQYMP